MYRRRDEWSWAVGCEACKVPDRRPPAERRPKLPRKTTLWTMVGDEACPVGLQVAQGEQPLVLQPVGRALHSKRSTIDDMRVNHRRRDAGVAEQFLDGPDVIPVLEQVGRKRVSQRIHTLPMNRAPRLFTIVTIRSTANP